MYGRLPKSDEETLSTAEWIEEHREELELVAESDIESSWVAERILQNADRDTAPEDDE